MSPFSRRAFLAGSGAILVTKDAAAVTRAQRGLLLSGKSPDIFLLAGQSNMVGYSLTYDASIDTTNTKITQWSATGANINTRVLAIDPLLHPSAGTPANSIGPGMAFARAYVAATGKNVLLVPVAVTGTSILSQWLNPGGAAFSGAVTFANNAIAASGGVVKGILWAQGEQDVLANTVSNSYQGAVESTLAALRYRINGAANAPVIIISMVPEWFAAQADGVAIDACHQAVPSRIPYAVYVAGAVGTGNVIHYTAPFARINGAAAFSALATAQANVPQVLAAGWDSVTASTQLAISGAGNVTVTRASGATWGTARTLRAKSSGKWYVEFTLTLGAPVVGVASGTADPNQPLTSGGRAFALDPGIGFQYPAGASGGPVCAQGDVVGCLCDFDGATVSFNKNGGAFGTTQAITTAFGIPFSPGTSIHPTLARTTTINVPRVFSLPSGASDWNL